MKYIYQMLADLLLETLDGFERLLKPFRRQPQPSLMALNVLWCTDSEWMERLVAYKQLDLWTFDR